MLLVPGIGLACLGLGEDLSTLVELSVTQTGGARHVRHVRSLMKRFSKRRNSMNSLRILSCHAAYARSPCFQNSLHSEQAKEGNGKKHDQHGDECCEVPFWCFMGALQMMK